MYLVTTYSAGMLIKANSVINVRTFPHNQIRKIHLFLLLGENSYNYILKSDKKHFISRFMRVGDFHVIIL